MKLYLIISAAVFIVFTACTKEPSQQVDGNLSLRSVVADQSGLIPVNEELGYAPVANAEIKLEAKTYYDNTTNTKKFTAVTDSAGVFEIDGLPLDNYVLTVKKAVTVEGSEQPVYLSANKLIQLDEPNETVDTIYTELPVLSDIVINEIYYCGSKNKSNYIYDQYVELYNNSDSTAYLDGLILCRGRQYHDPAMDSLDYVQVLYVYQFPGEPLVGREYPIGPHQFIVVAQDAFDHSKYIPEALDLSTADWEFFNPYYNEPDNPALNVSNVIPENSTDFMINLVHNFVLLADGSDYYYGEVSSYGYQYILIPISTV